MTTEKQHVVLNPHYRVELQVCAKSCPCRRGLVSCGCCTNGCTCFLHRDVPNGRPQRQCELHAGWTKDQFMKAWQEQEF